MKTQIACRTEPRWPAAVVYAFGDADAPKLRPAARVSPPRHASFGPIELRVDAGNGPSPIAILE